MKGLVIAIMLLAFWVAKGQAQKSDMFADIATDGITAPTQRNVFNEAVPMLRKVFDHCQWDKTYGNQYKGTMGKLVLIRIPNHPEFGEDYVFAPTDKKCNIINNQMVFDMCSVQFSVGIFENNRWRSYRAYDSSGELFVNISDSKKNYYVNCIKMINGDCYFGEMVDGKPEGYGIYIWSNGDAWCGLWKLGNGIKGMWIGYQKGVKMNYPVIGLWW